MTTIEKAINSKYTTTNRYGDLACVWYENGTQHSDTVVVNKSNRDYYYQKTINLYNSIIASAPTANQDKVRSMVEEYMHDNFTDDAYFIGVYSDNVNDMIKRLAKYM